jgi:hypothetical protein
MRAPLKKLTEMEWLDVFEARCRSKRGERLTEEERALIDRAYATDEKRYGRMEAEVFNATVPFGSAARWGRSR